MKSTDFRKLDKEGLFRSAMNDFFPCVSALFVCPDSMNFKTYK